MRIRLPLRTAGGALLFFAMFPLIPFVYALSNGEDMAGFLIASCLSALCGASLRYRSMHGCETCVPHQKIRIRDGHLIAAVVWPVACVVGAIPFYVSGMPALDALFESVSGLTGTGLTAADSVSLFSRSDLLWRAVLHWAGGMGIIVFAAGILGGIGTVGRPAFESISEAARTRSEHVAYALCHIYLLLTGLCAACLYISGMQLFDAFAYAGSLLGAGAFAPNDGGLSAYRDNGYVLSTAAVFMVAAGGSFYFYAALPLKRLSRVYKDAETFVYLKLLSAGLVTAALFYVISYGFTIGEHDTAFLETLFANLFSYLSLQTGSGLVIADDSHAASGLHVLFLAAMCIGGCAVSATGGLKAERVFILFEAAKRELRRAIHPEVVTPVTSGGRTVSEEVVHATSAFFFLYMAVYVAALLGFSYAGLTTEEAVILSAATLANVGGAFSSFGLDYDVLGSGAKSIAMLAMLMGRLEILTFLLLFTSVFRDGYRTKEYKK